MKRDGGKKIRFEGFLKSLKEFYFDILKKNNWVNKFCFKGEDETVAFNSLCYKKIEWESVQIRYKVYGFFRELKEIYLSFSKSQ